MSLFLLTILSLLPFTTPLCSPTLQPPASPPIAIANPLAYCPESTPPFDYLIHYTTVDPMGMDIECEGEGGGCGSVSNMEAFPVTGKGKVEVWLQASSPSSSSNTTSPIISTSVQIYTLPPTFTITPLLSSGYQTSPTGTSLNCTNCITLHRTSTVSSTPSSSYITLSTSCSPTPTNTDTKNMLIHYTTSSTPPTISSPSIPCGSLLNYTLDSPTHGALHTEIRLNFRLFPNPETPEDGNSGYGVYVVNSQTATWQLYISVDSFDSFESDKEAISSVHPFKIDDIRGFISNTKDEIRTAIKVSKPFEMLDQFPSDYEEVITDIELQDIPQQCDIWTHGGFFDTSTIEPLKNYVGYKNEELIKIVEEPRNVGIGGFWEEEHGHFHYYAGFLPPGIPYTWLVTGLGWLLRDGEEYLDVARGFEDFGIQTTGNDFFEVKSARAAVCVGEEGVSVVEVEGRTGESGINLYDFATLLRIQGFKDCVNIDGGGSTSLNYKGDDIFKTSEVCSERGERCAKEVAQGVCLGYRKGIRFVKVGEEGGKTPAATTSPTASPIPTNQPTATTVDPNDNNNDDSSPPADIPSQDTTSCPISNNILPWFLFVCSTTALICTTFWHKGHSTPQQHKFTRFENELEMVNRGSPVNNGDEEDFEGDFEWGRKGMYSYEDDDDDEEANPFTPSLRR